MSSEMPKGPRAIPNVRDLAEEKVRRAAEAERAKLRELIKRGQVYTDSYNPTDLNLDGLSDDDSRGDKFIIPVSERD